MKGKFFGVSTGPGDPGLMTIKAVRITEACDCIAAVDGGGNMTALSIAKKAVDLSGKTIIPLKMPMTRDSTSLSSAWDTAAETIAEYLDEGKDVAMLTLGDVSVYSTVSYVADRLSGIGYECEMCPGVTSFCAVASAFGIPLVTGGEPLIVIPSQCGDDEIKELLSLHGTKVVMKGAGRISRLIGECDHEKVYTAENCGLDNEHLRHDLPDDSGYFTTVIVK
ncbi:MAG: precorrin-2 C(20)-methyltransferase [Oscillospiraceae bacterium]|nr:precorrin-2 C(20)-methyltransferase [Oscillospiraceae bacterium]